MWAEDEFRPSEPQSPPLSDPDSDALFAIKDHEDAPAAHLSDEDVRPHDPAHAEVCERRESITSPAPSLTLDIAPPSEPAPSPLRAERSNPAPLPSGLLRSAQNDDSRFEQDADESPEASQRAAISLNRSCEQSEAIQWHRSLDCFAPLARTGDADSQHTASEPSALAIPSATAAEEPAPAARPLVTPIIPASASYAAPQPAPLQIAVAAPAVPADLATHLEQKSSPIGGVQLPKAVEGMHQEARITVLPLSQLSPPAPAPPVFQGTSASGAGFASGSALDTPAQVSVEYPVPPRVAVAAPANIATPVQSPARLSPPVPAPSAVQATSSSGGGGFTSSSALDVFAPVEQSSAAGSATPPQLTPASYTPLPAFSAAYSDSESVFDASPRGIGRGNGGAAPDTTEAEMLVLAPMVNGAPSSQVITVERRSSGFSARAGDLRALGIKLDPSINDEDTVALASLPGLEARYVDSTQSLDLKVPDALLIATQIGFQQGRTPIDISKITTTRGLLFNYRLFGSLETGRKTQLTGDVELVRTAGIGTFVTTGFFASSGRKTFVRGDSFFRLEDNVHAETGGGLINGGLGFIQALGKLGSLDGAAAASNYRGKQGTRLSAQYRFDLKRFSLFANVQREYGRYFDLGDVSSFRGPITDPAGLPIFPMRQRQSIERIGASFRPGFDPISFNVAYNHLRQGNSDIRTANLALRRRITNRISFNGNAIFDLEKRHDVALSIGLDVRLGRNSHAFVGADRANGRTNYNVSATGFGGGRQNEFGYAISQRGNDDGDASRSASLNYRFPQAFVAGTIDQSGSKVRGSLQLEGSLIAAGKDVFVANRVGEGFAVVKNAGPHVGILQGGRKIATSNGKGRALLPSLEPFSETRLSIDPTTLPADLEAENGTDFRVVTARRRAVLVDFGVRKVNAAIVVIFGKDGKPIPAGTQIDIGGKEPGLMGYDGEVFLKDLKGQNKVNIDLGPAGKCSATFSFDINGEAQPRIGPITCS